MYDLILRHGRVIDPKSGHDALGDVGFADGKLAYIGASCPDHARQEIDVTGLIVTPGLIDLHTHVYWGGTSLGVDAAATTAPAAAIRRPDLGHLTVGGVGDASILRLGSGEFDLVDVEGEHILAEQRLLAAGVVMGGKICVTPMKDGK